MKNNKDKTMRKKSLTNQLKEAKEHVKTLEQKVSDLESERQAFRNWLAQDFKFYIELLKENKYWSPAYAIETLSKRLQKVKSFDW